MTTSAIADPYWSRTESVEELVPREDPILWGSSNQADAEGAFDPAILEDYESQGFHHDPQRFRQSEAAAMLAEAERLANDVKEPGPGVVMEPGSRVVRSLFRLHRTSPFFRKVAQDPRLVNAARQILGSDVYIHQSRINFKPAFDGKEFFWHSDFETWHVEDGMPRMRALSVSISLTGNNEFNGPLIVVPGSHRTYVRCVGATPDNHHEQSLKKQEYGVPSREAMRTLVDEGGMIAPKGGPGAATYFECNLMHGSCGNLSPYPRTNLFIVYSSVENGTVKPFGGTPPRPEFLSEREVIPVMDL